jgi:nitrogen fixation protein FixH
MSAAANEVDQQRRAARRAGWFWGTLVVGFLSLQLTIGGVAIYLATGDPSVAVVPDYYQKAVDWDRTLAIRQASDQLGWRAEIDVTSASTSTGDRVLTIQILDASGQPVDRLGGECELYHHARASQRQRIPLKSVGRGCYQGIARMPEKGLWEISLRLEDQRSTLSFLHGETLRIGMPPVETGETT